MVRNGDGTFFADAFIPLEYTHQPFWHVILIMVTSQIRFLRINKKLDIRRNLRFSDLGR